MGHGLHHWNARLDNRYLRQQSRIRRWPSHLSHKQRLQYLWRYEHRFYFFHKLSTSPFQVFVRKQRRVGRDSRKPTTAEEFLDRPDPAEHRRRKEPPQIQR